MALLVAAAVVGGCGGDDSAPTSKVIVKVGDATITQAQYDRGYQYAIKHFVVGPGYTPRRRYNDPPKFTWCVKDRRKHAVGLDKDLSVAETRDRCARHIHGRTQWVLQHLIEAQWIVQEAKRYTIKTSSNPSTDAQTKLQVQIAARAARPYHPSASDIEAYYRTHRSDFKLPARRAAMAIVAKTQDQAIEARAALEQGASWASIAKKYDLDSQLTHLAPAEENAGDPISRTIYDTPRGRVAGPLRMPEGFYLLKVTKIIEPYQYTLGQMRQPIVEYLEAVHRSEAAMTFARGYRQRHHAQTICLTHLQVPECRNTPKMPYNNGETPGWAPSPPTRPQEPPAPVAGT